jgi:hypothetical protein
VAGRVPRSLALRHHVGRCPGVGVRATIGRPTRGPSRQSHRPRSAHGGGERTRPSNKRMQLTKLRAAPVLRAEVPPCAPAGDMDGGTASQLIRGVRWTRGEESADGLSAGATPASTSWPCGLGVRCPTPARCVPYGSTLLLPSVGVSVMQDVAPKVRSVPASLSSEAAGSTLRVRPRGFWALTEGIVVAGGRLALQRGASPYLCRQVAGGGSCSTISGPSSPRE